ncbi:MAG: HNH endonuclease [Gammaproteobacteria bacterium]|nr:HNH endonuclease [Gammaproteobacteria bacterium]
MKKVKTVHDLLCKAYTDLSVADTRIDKERAGKKLKNPVGYRESTFGEYFRGERKPAPLMKEEREKMRKGQMCHYCEKPFPSGKGLTAEHILPTDRGGPDRPGNIIWACQSCNSSKLNKDFIAWALGSDMGFPPIGLIRHYLKLVWEFCGQNGLMEKDLAEVEKLPADEIPFDWDSLKLGSSACPYPANVHRRQWVNKQLTSNTQAADASAC